MSKNPFSVIWKHITGNHNRKDKRCSLVGRAPLTHPSLKLGVSLSVRVRGNCQCYAQFDSKTDRVKQMGTNSD